VQPGELLGVPRLYRVHLLKGRRVREPLGLQEMHKCPELFQGVLQRRARDEQLAGKVPPHQLGIQGGLGIFQAVGLYIRSKEIRNMRNSGSSVRNHTIIISPCILSFSSCISFHFHFMTNRREAYTRDKGPHLVHQEVGPEQIPQDRFVSFFFFLTSPVPLFSYLFPHM
jgi:hypothetical protein